MEEVDLILKEHAEAVNLAKYESQDHEAWEVVRILEKRLYNLAMGIVENKGIN